jgi:hypothetical protein
MAFYDTYSQDPEGWNFDRWKSVSNQDRKSYLTDNQYTRNNTASGWRAGSAALRNVTANPDEAAWFLQNSDLDSGFANQVGQDWGGIMTQQAQDNGDGLTDNGWMLAGAFAAPALAPALGATGAGAAAGAMAGAAGSGGNLKSTLMASGMGAAGGWLGSQFADAPSPNGIGGGGSPTQLAQGNPGFFDGATASNAMSDGMLHADYTGPMASETGSVFGSTSELGQLPIGSRAPEWYNPTASFAQREGALSLAMDGTNAMADPTMMTSYASQTPFYNMPSLSTAAFPEEGGESLTTESTDPSAGGAMDMSGSQAYPTDPSGSTTIFDGLPNMDPSILSKMKQLYGTMKDPLAIGSALHQMYASKGQRAAMQAAMQGNQNAGFDHKRFEAMAADYMDPQKRMALMQSMPAFQASQDYLNKDMQRKLAQKGSFSQAGQGGQVSNNWAVPMLDVLGKNAAQWDQQLFGQIKDASGMGFNNLGNSAQLMGGMLPAMINNENNSNKQLWKAVTENWDSVPYALQKFLA